MGKRAREKVRAFGRPSGNPNKRPPIDHPTRIDPFMLMLAAQRSMSPTRRLPVSDYADAIVETVP
jgi:hypothetical protein